ncbi:MAG: hypothetical protein H7A23_03365 [Leptospiraceae bacterium]|nr:hypothetical protein [Leptospiraceae bacterium]
MKLFILFMAILVVGCNKRPLEKSDDINRMKVTYFGALNVQKTSVELHWGCSSETVGYLMYGKTGTENIQYLWLPSKQHFYNVTGLTLGNTYKAIAFCGSLDLSTSTYLQTFYTSAGISDEIKSRGIWILGGLGYSNTAISQVDLYDPVDDTWYTNVTSIPTARSYAGIASYNKKIYVFGGLVSTNPSNIVEQFDPYTETWTTMENMPTSLQGVYATGGDDAVYLMGGSVTNTVTASLPNVIYRFIPENGTSGQWDALTTSVSIPARTDFAGCSTGGTVYFNSGRANDGIAQLVSDAYIPSGNTISSTNEASFSVAAFGAASACYRTRPLGPYTQDNPAMFVLGGSTLDNTDQPPTAILASNRFEYYLTPSDTGTNVVSVGPNLPNSLYYPAAEISYEKRKIYVFGGANVVNVPTSKVYSLDLADPSQGTWTTESKDMPVARFGHKAVIINR